MVFAVTDIETTGSQPGGNSIVEIGICIVKNGRVEAKFHSLFNPGQAIPKFITGLTGITNEMVLDAPEFSDEAQRIFELLGNSIFVAHNVNFDFAFIQKSFEAINIRWNPKRLCTIRMSRRAFPGLRSYGLGALADHFGITQSEAHRALSDAETAAEIFLRCFDRIGIEATQQLIRKSDPEMFLPPALQRDVYENLPDLPGIYFMRDNKGKILYIGKARKIKSRVQQHFTRYLETSRAQKFLREVADIHYELCGWDLVSGILEDAAIRKWMPKYNKAQRAIPTQIHVNAYRDKTGRERVGITEGKRTSDAIKSFISHKGARNWMVNFCREFNISHRMAGLDIFDANEIIDVDHNQRMSNAIMLIKTRKETLILQGKGREEGEYSFVVYESQQNCWVGFSFDSYDDLEQLKNNLEMIPVSSVIDGLIRQAWEVDVSAKKSILKSF